MVKGIYQVAGPEVTDNRDCNVYLLNLGLEAVLIDTGLGAAFDKMLANIEAAGVPSPVYRRQFSPIATWTT